MAKKKDKSSLTHKKTISEFIKFTGLVSEDGLYVTIDEVETPVGNLFRKFAGMVVESGITVKQEEEIED